MVKKKRKLKWIKNIKQKTNMDNETIMIGKERKWEFKYPYNNKLIQYTKQNKN